MRNIDDDFKDLLFDLCFSVVDYLEDPRVHREIGRLMSSISFKEDLRNTCFINCLPKFLRDRICFSVQKIIHCLNDVARCKCREELSGIRRDVVLFVKVQSKFENQESEKNGIVLMWKNCEEIIKARGKSALASDQLKEFSLTLISEPIDEMQMY